MATTLRYSSISLDRFWTEIHGPAFCENESACFFRNEKSTGEPLPDLLVRLARQEIEDDHERHSDIRVCSCVLGELNPDPNT